MTNEELQDELDGFGDSLTILLRKPGDEWDYYYTIAEIDTWTVDGEMVLAIDLGDRVSRG